MNQDLIDLSTKHPWVLDFYNNIETLAGRKQYKHYYNLMMDFDRSETNKINVFIKYIDVKKAPILVIVGVLRSNYTIGHTLPAWKSFLEQAKVELTLRGENATDELQGLDKPYVDYFPGLDLMNLRGVEKS